MTTRRRFLQALAALPPALSFRRSLAADAATPDPSRLALIIGNSAYAAAPLVNPANDARAIGALFAQAGFTVDSHLDATRAGMLAAIERFGAAAKQTQARQVVFYYAGHGAQLDWRNYLLPVDALVERPEHIRQRCVDLGLLLGQFSAAKDKTFIVILDACRNNPFGATYHPEQKGLSQFDAPVGSLLAYATSPGNVASDGDGRNGLYTEHLVRELSQRNTRIEDALKRVRLNVRLASHGAQIPWETTSLEQDVFIFNGGHQKLSEAELEQQVEADVTDWARIKSSKKIDDWVNYLRSFPNGRFAEIAQMRVNRLLAEAEQLAAEERQREEQKAREQQRAREDQQRLEQQRIERERIEQQRIEQERIERERIRLAEEQRLAEQERIAEEQRQAAGRKQLAELRAEEQRKHQAAQQSLELKRRQEQERLEREQQRVAEAERLAAGQRRLEEDRRRLEQEKQKLATAASVKPEPPPVVAVASRVPQPPAAPAGTAALVIHADTPVPTLIAASANPYSAGRYPLNRIFTVGDTAHIRISDILTGIEEQTRHVRVTRVDHDADRVEYNNGITITDLMGNPVKLGQAEYDAPVQFTPAEFQVGKKWTAAFHRTQRGKASNAYFDLQIIGRETIGVPAGSFDAFRIEGTGWNLTQGQHLEIKLWLVPGINFAIRREQINRDRKGRLRQTERQELVALRQQVFTAS